MALFAKDNQIRNNGSGCREIARKTAIILIALVSVPALLIFCCATTIKFPPQIFGNNEDHFRAHVISPIPESVKILDIEFDDLIIHPDVAYYFRFFINRSDLKKIITYRSLEAANDQCFDPSPSPKWWKFPSPNNMEVYQFDKDGLIISLYYDASGKTAYYAYWTY